MGGRTFSGDDIAILRPEEIRQLPERQALVLAENGKPIIARLARCIDGKAGRRLLADQRQLRAVLAERSLAVPTAEARAAAALAKARQRGIATEQKSCLTPRLSRIPRRGRSLSLSLCREGWCNWHIENLIS
jgi:type IV secretion system protein VirD4